MPSDRVETVTPGQLPALFHRLAGQLIDFVEQRLRLAELELAEETRRLRSAAVAFAICFSLAAVGFLLVSASLALLLVRLGVAPWLACLLLGLGYVGVGALVLVPRLNKLAGPHKLFARTAAELRKDHEWIGQS